MSNSRSLRPSVSFVPVADVPGASTAAPARLAAQRELLRDLLAFAPRGSSAAPARRGGVYGVRLRVAS